MDSRYSGKLEEVLQFIWSFGCCKCWPLTVFMETTILFQNNFFLFHIFFQFSGKRFFFHLNKKICTFHRTSVRTKTNKPKNNMNSGCSWNGCHFSRRVASFVGFSKIMIQKSTKLMEKQKLKSIFSLIDIPFS